MSSFSLIANSEKVSALLAESSKLDFKLTLRSPTPSDISSNPSVFNNEVPPPLVIEIEWQNEKKPSIFPAFAIMRNKKHQKMVPEMSPSVTVEDFVPKSIDDVLYKVLVPSSMKKACDIGYNFGMAAKSFDPNMTAATLKMKLKGKAQYLLTRSIE